MIVVHFCIIGTEDRTTPPWMAEVLRRLDGRASAVFMILAGIGVSLMTHSALESADPADLGVARRTLIRRGVGLLILGFLNLTVWAGDILRIYGISLFVAAFLISRSDRILLVCSALFPAAFMVAFHLIDFERNWDWSTFEYRNLWTVQGQLLNLFYNGFRSVLPWTGLLTLGMWIGRRDLANRARLMRGLLTGLVVAMSAEAFSAWLVRHFSVAPAAFGSPEVVSALLGTESMPALPMFLLATGGTAVTIIMVCCLAVEWRPGRWWLPLAATGQMALTWYVAHILLGLGGFVVSGRVGTESLPHSAGLGVLFFVIALVCSTLRKVLGFQQGPLEAILRRMVTNSLKRTPSSDVGAKQ
jgi:uncharacterized membrane protein YeiB